MLALENLSNLLCPVYGDFYSFPWKRGPHDSILEYIEASKSFQAVRLQIFTELKGHDLIKKSLAIYNKENDIYDQNLEVRCSALRLLIQLLKSFP